jgi:hypothetical protein
MRVEKYMIVMDENNVQSMVMIIMMMEQLYYHDMMIIIYIPHRFYISCHVFPSSSLHMDYHPNMFHKRVGIRSPPIFAYLHPF